jgi:hypothetical protein
MATLETIEYKLKKGPDFPCSCFIIEEEEQIHIISPCRLDNNKVSEIQNKQKEINIIAPNNFHNVYLAWAQSTFPNASFYGPKRSAKVSGVKLQNLSDLKSKELDFYKIEGTPALSETCFYIKDLKTLIVTDLFFNVHKKVNLTTMIMMRLAGTYKKLSISRLVKFVVKDKKAFSNSIKRLCKLELDTVIPSHGSKISGAEFKRLMNH